jgi:hypothetical protein
MQKSNNGWLANLWGDENSANLWGDENSENHKSIKILEVL